MFAAEMKESQVNGPGRTFLIFPFSQPSPASNVVLDFYCNFSIIKFPILIRRRDMRFLVVAIVALALVPGLTGIAGAAGYQVVGKEECDCSPLVARGIYPDTLNKLHQAVYFPTVISAVDQVAMDLKSVVTHFVVGDAAESQESTSSAEETKAVQEKSAPPAEEKVQKQEKPTKEEKPATLKKKKSTRSLKQIDKKKKKIKVPSRTKEKLH